MTVDLASIQDRAQRTEVQKKRRTLLARVLDTQGQLDGLRLTEVEVELVAEKDFDSLLHLYEVGATRAPSPELGRALLVKAGLLLVEKFSDDVRAEEFFQRARASDSDNVDVLDALRAICAKSGRHQEAADLCLAIVDSVERDDKIGFLAELSAVYADKLGRPRLALKTLDRALQLAPGHRALFEKAFLILLSQADFREAARRLKHAEREEGLSEKDLGLFHVMLGTELVSWPFLHDEARVHLVRARELGAESALGQLDTLGHCERDPQGTFDRLLAEAKVVSSRSEAARRYMIVGQLCEQYQLGHHHQAEVLLERAILLDPRSVPTLFALRELYEKRQDAEGLEFRLRSIRNRLPVTVDAVFIHRALADFYAQLDERWESELSVRETILTLDPSDVECIERVEFLVREHGQFSRLIQIHQDRSRHLGDRYLLGGTHFRIAEIYQNEIRDPEKAKAQLEIAIHFVPYLFRALHSLREIYKEQSEGPTLVKLLSRMVDFAPDQPTRLNLLKELVESARTIDKETELSAYRRFLIDVPTNAEAKASVLELATELGQERVAADAFLEAGHRTSSREAVPLWLAAAELYEERLPESQQAIEVLGLALDADPSNQEARERLSRMTETADDPEAQLQTLREQREAESNPRARVVLDAKIARILFEDLDEIEEARAAFEGVLESDPLNDAALSALDAIYSVEQNFPKLEQVLRGRIEISQDDVVRSDLLLRLGQCLERSLQKPEEAVAAFLALLDVYPDHAEAIDSLLRLLDQKIEVEAIATCLLPIFGQRGRHRKQLEMLLVLICSAPEAEKVSHYARQAKSIAENRLREPQLALEHLEQALNRHLSDRDLILSFARLLSDQGEAGRAAETLSSWAEAESGDAKAFLLHLAGDLYEDAGDLQRAKDCFSEAFSASPEFEAAAYRLQRFYEEAQDLDGLERLLETRYESAANEEARVSAGLELATVISRHESGAVRARTLFSELLELRPEDTDLLVGYSRLLEEGGENDQLLDVLRRLEASSDENVRFDAHLKVLDLLWAERPAHAFESLVKAQALRPESDAVLSRFEQLLNTNVRSEVVRILESEYLRRGSHEKLADLLEEQISFQSPEDQRALSQRVALVRRDNLSDPEGALRALLAGHATSFEFTRDRGLLAEAALRANGEPELLEFYESQRQAGNANVELDREIARLWESTAQNAERAADAWRRVLEQSPRDAEAIENLERIHESGKDPAGLAEVLVKRGEAAEDDDQAFLFFSRAAGIFEELADAPERAAAALEQARAVKSGDATILRELARLYNQLGDSDRGIAVLRESVAFSASPRDKVRALLELGERYLAGAETEDAFEAFSDALIIDEEEEEALTRMRAFLRTDKRRKAAIILEPYLRENGKFLELTEVYEVLAETATDEHEVGERLLAAGAVYRDRLENVEDAYRVYSAVWEQNPERVEITEEFAELAKQLGRGGQFRMRLEEQIQSESDPEKRALMSKTLARVSAELNASIEERCTYWQNAFFLNPDCRETREGLEAALEDLPASGNKVRLLLALADADSSLDRGRLLQKAMIIAEAGHDFSQRVQVLERLVTIDELREEALDRYQTLCLQENEEERFESFLGELQGKEMRKDFRGGLLLRLARLRQSLGDEEGAVRYFSDVAALGPENAGNTHREAVNALSDIVTKSRVDSPDLAAKVAGVLEPHVVSDGSPEDLVSIKEAQLNGLDSVRARSALLLEIATLYETALARPDMALLRVMRAFQENPTSSDVSMRLEQLATKTEAHEELADMYLDVAEELEDRTIQLRFLRRAADIYDRVLDRPDVAVPVYEKVLNAAPGDPVALNALERAYRRTGNTEKLIIVYRGMLSIAEDENQKRHLLRQLAAAEESVGDEQASLSSYADLFRLGETDPKVLRRLVALYEKSGQNEELKGVLERQLASISASEDRATVLLRLAELKRGQDDAQGALNDYRRVLEERQRHPGAISGLTELFRGDDAEASAIAASVLAPIYLEAGAFEQYIDCLESQAKRTHDGNERKELLLRIADVYEENLGRLELALANTQRAFHEDPFDGALRARLEQLAENTSNLEELAAFYLDELESIQDADVVLQLRRRVAELYDFVIQDSEAAVEQYNQVLESAPGDVESLRALERLYKKQGSSESLAEIYRRRIAQAPDDEARSNLLREFARLQVEDLGDLTGAIASYKRLIEIDPNSTETLLKLGALSKTAGHYAESAEVFQQVLSIPSVGDRERVECILELARLKYESLEDRKGALELLDGLGGEEKLASSVVAQLREMVEDALADDDEALARGAGQILMSAYRDAENHSDLAELVRILAASTTDENARAELNLELGELYQDRLLKPELAFAAFTQAYLDLPERRETRSRLEVLSRELVMPDSLVKTFEAVAPKIQDKEEQLLLKRRIAEIYSRELGAQDRSIDCWQQVLVEAPGDHEALEALSVLYENAGRWAALVDVLEQRVDAVEEVNEKSDFLLGAARIWIDRLEEPAEARQLLDRAYALQPERMDVHRSLLATLDDKIDPELSFELLSRLVSHEDGPTQVEMQKRRARLLMGPLHRPDEAQALLSDVVEEAPDADSLELLSILYERSEAWDKLAVLLEKRIEMARGSGTRDLLQRRLGVVRGTRLGNAEEAIETWQEVLKRDPNDQEALRELGFIYLRTERFLDCASILRKRAHLVQDEAAEKEIRFELSELLSNRVGDLEAAVDSAKAVFEMAPHSAEELHRLQSVFENAGAFQEVVAVLKARAELADDKRTRAEIWEAIAAFYEDKVGRTSGVAEALEQVLEADPANLSAYERLVAIYDRTGDFQKLAGLYGRRVDLLDSPDDQRALLLQLSEIQEEKLGQLDLAFSSACRAFSLEGADEQALKVAERLADATDNWEVLAEIVDDQIEQVPFAQSLELRRRLADINEKHLRDADAAEEQLRKILAIRPQDSESREQLLTLFEASGRWPEMVQLLEAQVDIETTDDAKIDVLRRIGGLQHKAAEVDSCVQTYRRILDLDGDDQLARDHLIEVFRESERYGPLVEALSEKRDRAVDKEQSVAVGFEIAELCETHLADRAGAVLAYRRVLQDFPASEEALSSLERLYADEKDWDALVEVLRTQAEQVEDDESAVELLMRASAIYDGHLQSLEGAKECLMCVLDRKRDHIPAFEKLEAIAASDQDWNRLVELYDQHAELEVSPERQAKIFFQQASILDSELQDKDRAKGAYRAAIDRQPAHADALHALATLYSADERWEDAVDLFLREADATEDDARASDNIFRAAQILRTHLGDSDRATTNLEAVLTRMPSHTGALSELRKIQEAQGNVDGIVALLSREAEATQDSLKKAMLYEDAATRSLEVLGEEERARALYEKAVEANRDYLPALRVVSELHFANENWTEAQGFLEHLTDLLSSSEEARDDELAQHQYRLGYIAEKLGDEHQALKRYLASYDLDRNYLPTLEGLASALVRAERLGEAADIFIEIANNHAMLLTEAEIVELHFQIGEIRARQGQDDPAEIEFKKALEIDRDHTQTLGELAKLCERKKSYEEAYDFRERMIFRLSGARKLSALLEQGELCRQKIKEPYRAIDAYSEAKRLEPDNLDVLRALVELFDQTRQMPRLVEALSDLARAMPDDDPDKLGVMLNLARAEHKHGRTKEALQVLNHILDTDAKCLEAFEFLERILVAQKDWKSLEQNYQRMIQRLPDRDERARKILWRSLADLYVKALKDEENAKIALGVVLKIDDRDTDAKGKLADILSLRKETAPKALQLYHELLVEAEEPAVPARRMFLLYSALEDRDRAFCALGALVLAGAASDEEVRAYELLLKRAPSYPKNTLSDDLWRRYLLHEHCRGSLADIASVIFRGAPELFGEAQSALELKKKEAVDMRAQGKHARVRLRYFDVWHNLARAMGVGEMDHYHRPGSAQAPRMYPGVKMALVAGEGHDVFRVLPQRDLVFILGREMAVARPELAMIRALRAEEVAAAFEAAIRLWVPNGSGTDLHELGVDPYLVQRWQKALKKSMSRRALTALKEPVTRCVEARRMRRLAKYLRGAEHSLMRAAFLFSGDAMTTRKLLQASEKLVEMSERRRIRELLLFALSEEHFELRRHLGVSIGQ